MDTYNEERKENSQAIQFINLLQKLENKEIGNYYDLLTTKKKKGKTIIIYNSFNKQKLREYMKIEDKTQFANKILCNADVVDFMKKHNIINQGQSIVFSNIA